MQIKILGSGCAKCNELKSAVKSVVSENKIEAEISHISDFSQMASYGVMSLPALIINEKLASSGKILTKNEILEILKNFS